MLNKNERHGKVEQVKGHIKQAVGAVTGDERLKAEGEADEAMGTIEETVGRVARKTGDAIDKAVKAVKH